MATPIKTRILLRIDELSNWNASSSVTLGKGEMGIATLDGEYVEVRVGDGSKKWANSYKLKIAAEQISGLVETINTQISGIAQEYKVVSAGENAWKLQTKALSSSNWTDVEGSTWSVELSNYYDKAAIQTLSTTIENEVIGASTDLLSADTVNGAKKYAKEYTDEQIAALNIDDYATKTEAAEMSAYAYGQASAYANTICTDISTTVAADYLTKSAFNDLSNEIGLSAATAENYVITKKDIADLASAMHFRGAVTPTEGQTDVAAIEAYYIEKGLTETAGDVVIITTNSKEYVYSGTAWVELGDERLYATKAEVAGISAELTGDIDYLSDSITSITATYATKDEVSAYALSTDVDTLVATVSAATVTSANSYTDTKISALDVAADEGGNADAGFVTKVTETDGKVAVVKKTLQLSDITDVANISANIGLSDYALSADVTTLVNETSAAIVGNSEDLSSADTINGAKKYADAKIDALNISNYALSADVDALVGTVSAETLVSANAYTDALCASLSATVETDYIKHGEVVDTDLSGFFILSCGGAELRTVNGVTEPTFN